MNDRRIPPDHDERLSAYLAGELSDNDATALEQELADDAQLRGELDALADALVVLAGADEVEEPDGFDDRLRARLEAESSVTDLGQRRERARRANRWTAIGTAAAVVVLGAVMGGNALRSMGGGDLEAVSGDVAEQGGSGASAGAGAAQDAAGPPSGPVIVTDGRRIASQAQLRRHFESLPEVQALLGVDTEDAVQVAQAYTQAVPEQFSEESAELRTAPQAAAAAGDESSEAANGDIAASSGGAEGQDSDLQNKDAAGLDRCLTTITEGATEPLVPARIETLRYQGRRAIAYVLVTAEPDSDTLDRTEVWVVAQSDCDTLVFQQY